MPADWKSCPKCSSASVFTTDGPGVGWDVMIRVHMASGSVPDGGWTTYLCTDCGYFENYVTRGDWLAKIKGDPASQGWRALGGT